MTNNNTMELAWLRKNYRMTTIMFAISNMITAAALVFTVAVVGCDDDNPVAPGDPIVQPSPLEPEKPTPEPEPPKPAEPVLTAELKDLLNRHNIERAMRDAGDLQPHPLLIKAAKKHADWMAKNNIMSHVGPNGERFTTRLRDVGYRAGYAAENIAASQKTAEHVFRVWINSQGHRTNIYNRRYKAVGFAVSDAKDGKRFWCAVFGATAPDETMTATSDDMETSLPEPIESEEEDDASKETEARDTSEAAEGS